MFKFNWFSSRLEETLSKQKKPRFESIDSSRLAGDAKLISHHGHSRTYSDESPGENRAHQLRKQQVSHVVRETMAKNGLESSRFTFKVLSLDSKRRTYIVAADICAISTLESQLLPKIEQQIIKQADSMYEVAVSTVYWRFEAVTSISQVTKTATTPSSMDAGKVSVAANESNRATSRPSAGNPSKKLEWKNQRVGLSQTTWGIL